MAPARVKIAIKQPAWTSSFFRRRPFSLLAQRATRLAQRLDSPSSRFFFFHAPLSWQPFPSASRLAFFHPYCSPLSLSPHAHTYTLSLFSQHPSSLAATRRRKPWLLPLSRRTPTSIVSSLSPTAKRTPSFIPAMADWELWRDTVEELQNEDDDQVERLINEGQFGAEALPRPALVVSFRQPTRSAQNTRRGRRTVPFSTT